MFRRTRKHLNPASLIAMVALFAALGGVSYAAATIGSPQIKNNSIRSIDVRNGGLTGKDLRKDSVGGAKIKESTLGQVPSAATADNATQAQNAVDSQNAVNAQSAVTAQTASTVGPNGVGSAALQANSVGSSELKPTVRRSASVNVTAGGTAFQSRACLAGERMLSGGAIWSGGINAATAAALHIVHSYPVGTTSWGARGYNGTAGNRTLTVYAICLPS
jgi:hypothetical protein